MVTIHVIDRDPAVRLAARQALEPAGFAVSEAADEAGATFPVPDLVIADFTATSLAGIRRRHPGARVLTIGEDGIAKPFTASQLLAEHHRDRRTLGVHTPPWPATVPARRAKIAHRRHRGRTA